MVCLDTCYTDTCHTCHALRVWASLPEVEVTAGHSSSLSRCASCTHKHFRRAYSSRTTPPSLACSTEFKVTGHACTSLSPAQAHNTLQSVSQPCRIPHSHALVDDSPSISVTHVRPQAVALTNPWLRLPRPLQQSCRQPSEVEEIARQNRRKIQCCCVRSPDCLAHTRPTLRRQRDEVP